MTISAKYGVSWTRNQKRRLSIETSSQSVSATAEAERGSLSITAISPNIAPGPIVSSTRPSAFSDTEPLDTR